MRDWLVVDFILINVGEAIVKQELKLVFLQIFALEFYFYILQEMKKN